MAIAGKTAAHSSLVTEGLIILALYGLAEATEKITKDRTERSKENLVSGIRRKYLLEKDGRVAAIDTSSIVTGDTVINRIGETIPIDGVTVSNGVVDE